MLIAEYHSLAEFSKNIPNLERQASLCSCSACFFVRLEERFSREGNLNPLVTNGLSHPYHLDESTFICRDTGSNISILFHSSMKFLKKTE